MRASNQFFSFVRARHPSLLRQIYTRGRERPGFDRWDNPLSLTTFPSSILVFLAIHPWVLSTSGGPGCCQRPQGSLANLGWNSSSRLYSLFFVLPATHRRAQFSLSRCLPHFAACGSRSTLIPLFWTSLPPDSFQLARARSSTTFKGEMSRRHTHTMICRLGFALLTGLI